MAFFICYICYKQSLKIYISPILVIVTESNVKYIILCALNLLNFMALKNGRVRNEK